MGWYAMALVDILEFLPENHARRGVVTGALERLAAAVAKVQDPDKGVWWQVLDAPKQGKNFLESSASAMFVYALSKGMNKGWLDKAKYEPVAAKGWSGILHQFIDLAPDGALDLTQVCKVAGLGVGPGGGPNRDGTFAYYTGSLTPPVLNDPKGLGAFILAATEREP
jgi:unsaturated rhamnogalacturonyl hydrolase